ncbi:GumC family protein [Granulicella sibirica]|uniref:Tyrosine-protein kinase Wzc n=1 Tax=Granulicella sibirica TaxID=2479048 RepID=A0A4V1L691_9BACT|nr:Wzz/FepE/Etk N-terminal domain-containing protein [Granulicella sibirica]RXH58444.1 Tyrosine-protein kinase Wzc [Granulicella sibirica]
MPRKKEALDSDDPNLESTDPELTAPQLTDGLDLLDILLVLSAAKRKIAAFTLIATILGTILALVLRPTFTATALVLPPQQGPSASSMLGQLGSLASLASGSPLKNPADVYVGILNSRTIADAIIGKYGLSEVYRKKTLEDTRKALKSNSRFLATNDGMIHILVDDHTPQRASAMANAYVDELYAMNSHLAITEAAQRRVFFDQELTNERKSLTEAEDDLKQTAEKTGVIQLNGQAESIIRSIAQIRAQIAAQEVRIQSLRTFATDQNPEAIQAEQEAAALRSQLAKLENDPQNTGSGNPEVVAGQLPAVSLEYTRKYRELKYHETLFELLSKQYEAARIDEAKAAPLLQVVDRAIPPDQKSSPSKAVLILGSCALGFFIGCVASLLAHFFCKIRQVPKHASQLIHLRNSLRIMPWQAAREK